MLIKLFWKENCPQCPLAKALVSQFEDTPIELFDIEEPNGLAEAAFYNVIATPSIVLVDDRGGEIKSWRGIVPSAQELRRWI